MITRSAPPETTTAPQRRHPALFARSLLLVIVLAGAAQAGCGLEVGERFGRAAASAGVLRVHLREPAVELDPARAGTPLESAIARQLFSGLVEIEDDQAVPSLASSWTLEGRHLVMRLRHDARFSDGTPLTADDIVWSWRRAVRPSTGASDLRLSTTIANGDALARGTLLRISPSHGDAEVRGGGAPYAIFRDRSVADDAAGLQRVFAAGTPVRVLDTNARICGPGGATPLASGPDASAAAPSMAAPVSSPTRAAQGAGASPRGAQAANQATATLRPGEVATVIGLVESKGAVMLQLRAAGGAVGWAPAAALAVHVPAIGVVPVVYRGGPSPQLRAGPDAATPVRAVLHDESAVEVLERGAVLSLVVDLASGATGFIESAFLDDTLRERRWFLVQADGPANDAHGAHDADAGGAIGWVSEQELVFDPSLLDVTARDARTLAIGLAVDVDRALKALAAPVARPVLRRVVEEHGRAWIDQALVTSGPFTILERDARGGVVLARSPSSFEAGRAHLDRVELVYLQRATTALHLYRAGLLDAVLDGALPRELAGTLSRASDWTPGAAGGALIAPEVHGFDGDTLELRDVFIAPLGDVAAPTPERAR